MLGTGHSTRLKRVLQQSATVLSPKLTRVHMEMIESAGRLGQLFGLPRSTGQIYGLLYLAPRPLALDDMVESLGISKGSASTGTRQLTALHAIKQVWIHGERRDHYEIDGDVPSLLRAGYSKFVEPRLRSSRERLERMGASLDEDLKAGAITSETHRLCADRLHTLLALQTKLRRLRPLVEQIL